MSGRVGDLSPQQEDALKSFRENVKDVLQPKHDNYFLLRFLRARKFDLKKTEEMFRNMIAWRKRHGVDTILNDYTVPDVIQKYLTGGFCGFDKEGCPVYIDPLGRIDPRGLLRSAKKSDIIRTKIYTLEKFVKMCEDQSLKLGRRIEQLTYIVDQEHLGFKHIWKPGIDLFNEIMTLIEDNYPEGLKVAFNVNAPIVFPIAWKLIKPFLAEETAKKVKVYGSGNYQRALLEYVDKNQLPMAYGGTMVDANGDSRCESKISQGGEVPKELYSQTGDAEKEDFTSTVVKNRSLLELEFKIARPNSILRWEFLTEGYDIGFGVYKRTKEDEKQKPADMEVVVQNEKITCHLYPEDGNALCKSTGTYVVIFDNTYSMTRSKKLFYNVDVVDPDEDIKESEDGTQYFIHL